MKGVKWEEMILMQLILEEFNYLGKINLNIYLYYIHRRWKNVLNVKSLKKRKEEEN